MPDSESGYKSWLRYIVVPFIARGRPMIKVSSSIGSRLRIIVFVTSVWVSCGPLFGEDAKTTSPEETSSVFQELKNIAREFEAMTEASANTDDADLRLDYQIKTISSALPRLKKLYQQSRSEYLREQEEFRAVHGKNVIPICGDSGSAIIQDLIDVYQATLDSMKEARKSSADAEKGPPQK